MNVETGGFVNLTQSQTLTEGKPVWSPDGKFIYYHTNLTGDQDIRRERANGSQAIAETIVGYAGNQFQVALSPDGTEICYTQGSFSNDAARPQADDPGRPRWRSRTSGDRGRLQLHLVARRRAGHLGEWA